MGSSHNQCELERYFTRLQVPTYSLFPKAWDKWKEVFYLLYTWNARTIQRSMEYATKASSIIAVIENVIKWLFDQYFALFIYIISD